MKPTHVAVGLKEVHFKEWDSHESGVFSGRSQVRLGGNKVMRKEQKGMKFNLQIIAGMF